MSQMKVRTVVARITLVLTMVGLTMVATGAPASAAWAPPAFVRTVGMRGEAGVYPFGMEYNPVTHEILVGDYWNYRVRRYDLNGNPLGSFFLPPNQRHGQPYGVIVDPRNGDIYVLEWREGSLGANGWVSHWSPTGTFIDTFQLMTEYPGVPVVYDAWGTIDQNGYLYVADSHATIHSASFPPQIRVFDLNNNHVQIAHWGTWGTAPGQIELAHGVDTDDQGHVFVAEAHNLTIDVYDTSGNFLYNFGSQGPESQVGAFTGDLRGLAVDRVNGWVYVVDAEASQIEKFDLAGNPLAHWGTEGTGPGQFADGGRDITVDANGNVWVADFGNYRFFEYDSNGNLLNTYPGPAQFPVSGGFSQPRDVAVDASGNIWAVDSWNHRFEEFAPNGSFIGSWGFRNSHPPYGMDYPRGIAVDPATGNIWIANTRDHVIRVYRPDGSYVTSIGSTLDSNNPGSFRWPMDIEFFGGRAYVSGYYQSGLKVLDASTGTELFQIRGSNNGVAVDPATGNIYVLTWTSDRVSVYNSSGTFLYRWGSTGNGDGQFQNPWDIDIVNGSVYVTDAQLKRVQVFDLAGNFLGKFGSGGTGPYQFSSPSGITHDSAGNIYIADANNDRIEMYNPSATPPSGDTTRPTGTFTFPSNNAMLPGQTVILQGTASDNVGVGVVGVAIRDNATNLWWDGSIASWGTTKVYNLSMVVGSAPTTNVTWQFGFVGESHGGSYRAEVRVTDTSGNFSASPFPNRTFTVT